MHCNSDYAGELKNAESGITLHSRIFEVQNSGIYSLM